jgi:hypothetical protein
MCDRRTQESEYKRNELPSASPIVLEHRAEVRGDVKDLRNFAVLLSFRNHPSHFSVRPKSSYTADIVKDAMLTGTMKTLGRSFSLITLLLVSALRLRLFRVTRFVPSGGVEAMATRNEFLLIRRDERANVTEFESLGSLS